MRRRRLDAYRGAPDYPGKARAMAAEQARYDQWLIVAAHMLEVYVPDVVPTPGCPIPPEERALLEDRLTQAGLDVFARRPGRATTSWATTTPSSYRWHLFGAGSVVDRWRAECPFSRRTRPCVPATTRR